MRFNWIGFGYLLRKEMLRFGKVWYNTLLPPAVQSALFLGVFGIALGRGLEAPAGLTYAQFMLPGIMIMTLISAPMYNSGFSIMSAKWWGYIKDVLSAPVSHSSMILSVVIAGMMRGMIVATSIYLIAMPFGMALMHNFWLAAGMAIFTTMSFALVGLLLALAFRDFDSMVIIEPIVLMPLTFLGGVFYSITILPEFWQKLSLYNPFLYVVNSFRYGITGFSDTAPWIGLAIVAGLATILFFMALHLYNKGWKIRD